jgi:hypothetical protein
MIKLVSILMFAVLLLSVSSATYVKKASAISFANGRCPSGEVRDYMGICFPIKECKASLFAAAGTCAEEPSNIGPVTKVPGTVTVGTVTAPKYAQSPILGGEHPHSLKNLVNAGAGAVKKGWCNLYPTMNCFFGGSGNEPETCKELAQPKK